MKIHQTQDYTLFRRISGNRVVSNAHVNRLKRAMESDPTTIEYNPIIVNEEYEVIDGQHRLEAIEKLGLPVSFIQMPGLDLSVVQKLNSVAKQWSPMDYAKSYRELGNKSYSIYIDFKHEFGFNHDILLKYLSLDSFVTNTTFKEGKLKVADVATSRKYCEYLSDVGKFYERATLRSQALGLLTLFRSKSYDHSRMMDKLQRHADRIQEQKSALDFARELERIYNYRVQDAVRLF